MPDQVTISVRQTRKVVRHTPVHYRFSHAPLRDKFCHTSVYFSQTWSDDRLLFAALSLLQCILQTTKCFFLLRQVHSLVFSMAVAI